MKFDIYCFYAENEKQRFTFYYTYHENIKVILEQLSQLCNPDGVYIYDVFPGLGQEEKTLDEPLSVITKNGQEMFLPPGSDVVMFDCGTILYGLENEESDQALVHAASS